jgi:L-fuculose-phosphate aldolase
MSVAELRLEVVSAARRLEPLGLTQGTSGNISARTGDGFLVTPSAVPYAVMVPDDLVLLDLEGGVHGAPALGSPRRPSTEWRMHAGILRERPDVGAIVHAHPPWSTALSCLRRDIPAFHYMVAVAGGDVIRCADYATFGTAELASAAVAALGERRACLLANHGIIACGATVASALALAVEVEALAGQYMRALSVGRPSVLTEDEMASVLEAFEGYGR